ncbi:MAG TPA: hypothetical protein VGP33_16875 [Chloroflexota bacterium]|nr:hypothetical protein [Chloroflexota bacterium]
MAETAAQTQQAIARTRGDMTATLNELEAAVRELLDWQARVRRQPLLYAGIALAAGFVIAGGPGRAFRHGYWLIRPSAKRKAQANRYLLHLQETLDETLGGLPLNVAEQAKDLRLTINRTDPKAKSEGTIVIERKSSTFEQLASKGVEAAAAAAAGLITKRLLDEMNGGPKSR